MNETEIIERNKEHGAAGVDRDIDYRPRKYKDLILRQQVRG